MSDTPKEAETETLSRVMSRLVSNVAPFGHFEGGPSDGVTFKRNWNSETMSYDGAKYRINRDRVERFGDAWAVFYEFAPDESENEQHDA